MAIDIQEVRSVKGLTAALRIGESFFIEEILRATEYPNIPEEVRHYRVVKTSATTVRLDKWD